MKPVTSHLYRVVYSTTGIKSRKPCFRAIEYVVADDAAHAQSILSSFIPGIFVDDIQFLADIYLDGDSEFDLPF